MFSQWGFIISQRIAKMNAKMYFVFILIIIMFTFFAI